MSRAPWAIDLRPRCRVRPPQFGGHFSKYRRGDNFRQRKQAAPSWDIAACRRRKMLNSKLLVRLRQMPHQSHQAAVAPHLSFGAVLRRRPPIELLGDSLQKVAGPVKRLGLCLCDAIHGIAVTAGIVGYSTRSVEIDGLEWSKEGPTKTDAFAGANINIVHRGQAFRNHAECLLQNRGLQAVHKKTLDLTLHDD